MQALTSEPSATRPKSIESDQNVWEEEGLGEGHRLSPKPHPQTLVTPKSIRAFVIIACVLLILLIAALFAYRTYTAMRPASLPQGTVTISQSVLEAKFGLHVNLVAVTGAGGFVDLRLKMVDGDKAKLLLADAKNFPALVSEQGVALNAPADTRSQQIEYISGGNLFIMYPNAGNAITRGSSVRIVFGATVVEPIDAK